MATDAKLGHFDLLEEVGHGGMGTVYRAFDPTLNREVAIKVLRGQQADDPEFVEDFLREARNAAAISHPHIVQVHFVGEQDGQYYIVMELLRGRTLRHIIENDGPLDEERALDIALQVTEALRAAYKHEMIHGDVKPANILITDDVGAKVLDFGLAKLANVEVDTEEGIWGSPYYISPERVGQRAEDFRSDVYSLGATMFDALTGRPPFDAPDRNELAFKRLQEKPPLLRERNPNITARTEEVVNKMLSKSPLLRYRDYDHLLEQLHEAKTAATGKRLGVTVYGDGQAPAATRPTASPARAAGRRAKSGLPGWLVAVVVILAIVGSVWFFYFRTSPSDEAPPLPPPRPEGTPSSGGTTVAPVAEDPDAKQRAEEQARLAEQRRQAEAARQRKVAEEKQQVQAAETEVAPLLQTMDYKAALARYEPLGKALETAEGQQLLTSRLARVRVLDEFKSQLTADFEHRPYDRGEVQTRKGSFLAGSLASATKTELVFRTQYGELTAGWRDIDPASIVKLGEFYIAGDKPPMPPADRARRHLTLATFCQQSGFDDTAGLHVQQALKLDPRLRPEVVLVFGDVPAAPNR